MVMAAIFCSPSLHLFLGERLYHFGAEVIHRLHLCGLQGQLAHLVTLETIKMTLLYTVAMTTAHSAGDRTVNL